jgi:MFS family permease
MKTRLSAIAATVALGGLLFGYNTGVISGALLFLQIEFHLSAFMSGVITSIALGGAAAGAMLAGPAADGYGRRYALLGTALLFITGPFHQAWLRVFGFSCRAGSWSASASAPLQCSCRFICRKFRHPISAASLYHSTNWP